MLNVGNLTLAWGSTYAPLLTGLSGSHDLFNFNSSAVSLYTSYPGVSNTYPAGSVPSPPSSGVTTTPYGGTGILAGLQQGTADGLAARCKSVASMPTTARGFLFGSNTSDLGGGFFQLIPTDITDSSIVNVKIKLTNTTTQVPYFTVGLDDINQDFMMWTIPTSLLNTSTYTTVSLNITSQGLPVSGLGNGNYFDISAVTSFVVAADYGMSNGQQNLTFNADIDDIWTSGATNCQLAATDSVSLGGATLTPRLLRALPLRSGSSSRSSIRPTLVP